MWIKFKAKIVKFNNSVYCLIPKEIIKKEKLKIREEVIVKIN